MLQSGLQCRPVARTITASAISPRSSPTSCRAAASNSRADAGPDTRSYRVSFEKIARTLPDFKPQWDARKGAEQLYEAYSAIGSDARRIRRPALSAHQPHQEADGRGHYRQGAEAPRTCGASRLSPACPTSFATGKPAI